MTIVFKVSDNVKELMIKHYSKKYPTKPQYTVFQVKDFDCVTTLYESGKVMFQGIGADIEASIWIEKERILNNRYIDIENKKDNKKKENKKTFFWNISSVGSDEVGTGDYFGPLVFTASFVPKEKIQELKDLGIRDSKKVTDDKIIEIAPKLMKEIIHSTFVLDNVTYNKYHNSENNMNKMKAIMHNKCLLNVLKNNDIKYDKIVIDQFEKDTTYYNHIKEAGEIVKNITFETKAEDKYMSVAVSSIISRYIFLKSIKELSNKYNMEIPLNANTKTDEAALALVKKYGFDILNECAKLNFANTQKIKEMLK